MPRQQRTTALEDLMRLEQQLGHMPTTTQFLHELGRVKKANRQHGSRFELVAAHEEGEEGDCNDLIPYFTFLHNGIQQTSMTKCFKGITLQAFVALDGLRQPPILERLAQKSREQIDHYPVLAAKDIRKPNQRIPLNG